MLHVAAVILLGNIVHAGCGAALDLVLQTRAGTVIEHGILAGAQTEHLLQQLDAFPHRHRVGERPVVAVVLLLRTTMERQPRIGIARQHDVGVGFVVAEQHVVARHQRLDEIVFQQQRLRLGACHSGFDARDLGNHQARARAGQILLEIGGNALLQVACLADINDLAGGIDHAVDAGQVGQRLEERLGIKHALHPSCRQA